MTGSRLVSATKGRLVDRARNLGGSLSAFARYAWIQLAHAWRRSLQFRVVTTTLALSTSVVLILGVVLQTQIADRLIDAKTDAAEVQIENSKREVEFELGTVDPSAASLSGRLSRAVDRLTSASGVDATTTATAGTFEPVIIDGSNPSAVPGGEQGVGPVADVPAGLRAAVENGSLAHKITTVDRENGDVTMLVVGVPVSSAGRNLQLYLLFPLSAEESTLNLIQSTLLVGGLVLLLLIATIASLVARQVVAPVRRAAEVAERFADGHLEERITVAGEDEMARLGTSFNEMATSIQRQIRQLEEFGALQRGFTSDVSHELRTPLTTVRMAADVLHASRGDMPAALSRSSELLVAELDRFEALLTDLLEISRMDSGVAEVSVETVDLGATVSRVVNGLRGVVERSGSTVEVRLPPEPVFAEIDPRRVERIIRNLVSNALDHGEGRPVTVLLSSNRTAAAVLVRDRGVGLRPGEADRVFTRFWRADPSRNRQTGGTGLGLSISLEDARLHDGWLEAWGSPGEGAAFRLTVPLRRGVPFTTSPLPLGPDRAGRRPTAGVPPKASS